jgi:hypothetical protein
MELKRLIITISVMFMAACTSKSERVFMMGCAANEAMKEPCECIYDELRDHYPDEVLEKMDKGYAPPDFLDKMAEAAKICKV